jgi:acetoacetyl-CoA synthetase
MDGTVAEGGVEAGSDRGMGYARLVQLRSGCPGPCLFLLPGTGGRVEGFADLATLLQTSMPVYAIEARGVREASQPDGNLEELVTHYLDRIRNVQATGPYFLLGHSFGGMVVFEMAQRLIASGEKVASLILLDTVVPMRYWPFSFFLVNLGRRMQGHVSRLRCLTFGESVMYYSRRLMRRLYGLQDIPAELKLGHDIARVLLANDMLGKSWRPEFYPDKLILFCSKDVRDLDTVWRDRVQELEVHSTAGGHVNLIERPHVIALASEISACLLRASSRQAAQPAVSV